MGIGRRRMECSTGPQVRNDVVENSKGYRIQGTYWKNEVRGDTHCVKILWMELQEKTFQNYSFKWFKVLRERLVYLLGKFINLRLGSSYVSLKRKKTVCKTVREEQSEFFVLSS